MPHSVSLVIADTESYVLANNAIEQCMSQFRFDEVVVFTDRIDLWPNYRTQSIHKIQSSLDYSKLMLFEVPKHIRTEFFIVVQYDGFILDGNSFSTSFYEFDYIGSPWPKSAYPYFRVGNGGFSWRSRRLALAAASMASFWNDLEPEDEFICRIARVALETRHGCLFADENTATGFASELILTNDPVFGFHGLIHMPVVYKDSLAYLIGNLPERVFNGRVPLHARVGMLDEPRQAEFWSLYRARLGAHQSS
jgi:hypothetical protein